MALNLVAAISTCTSLSNPINKENEKSFNREMCR